MGTAIAEVPRNHQAPPPQSPPRPEIEDVRWTRGLGKEEDQVIDVPSLDRKPNDIAANAIDWWINKLNTMHLVPVNAATLLRDINAKQLGSKDFRPRPLSIDNFTDAELDAIHSLSLHGDKGYSHITDPDYDRVGGRGYGYGKGSMGLGKYLSPLRSVSTTLGQATVGNDGKGFVVRDTYDFNRSKAKVYDDGKGNYIFKGSDEKLYRVPKSEYGYSLTRDRDGAYGRLRSVAANIGHADDDPDEQKIHAEIPIEDIKKRLGDRLGKLDIYAPQSKKDFILNTADAGGLTAAPIGAVLGVISGAIRLIDKRRRKKWIRTMLSHVLGGAAIASLIGMAGGGLAANQVYGRFEKKSSEDVNANDRKRRNSIKRTVIKCLAYGIPVAGLIGAGAVALNGFKRLNELAFPTGTIRTEQNRDWAIEHVKSLDEL